ncbi:hypothetical protein BLNAU_17612 [Blattamonas nauphoetae]|uniref:Uncharacterized protein n=1 Tax=Blattamonas nauphoetae TaxID=2049346 RepID=A0ABQ9X6R4_9EUKA|nr:hypothetical protein BLNAU_17612 [Blattamonas nauphoetae]
MPGYENQAARLIVDNFLSAFQVCGIIWKYGTGMATTGVDTEHFRTIKKQVESDTKILTWDGGHNSQNVFPEAMRVHKARGQQETVEGEQKTWDKILVEEGRIAGWGPVWTEYTYHVTCGRKY